MHPVAGYHQALRELTRKTARFIIDDAHYLRRPRRIHSRRELDPDLVLASPSGRAFRRCLDLRRKARTSHQEPQPEDCDTGGIGGTLAGNALSLAAMRATLTKVLTKEAFDRMIPMAQRWAAGVQKVIDDFGMPWSVTRLGRRAEYLFGPNEPKNGCEAHDAMDFELERFMHLFAMNRGILLTPFHNMALMSPSTAPEDVDQHSKVSQQSSGVMIAAGLHNASPGTFLIR